MPYAVPTIEELERMPWHARQRAKVQIRALLLALQGDDHRCNHGSDQPSAAVLAERLEWALKVKADAKAMEKEAVWDCAPDPDAAAHRAALLEAIS